MRVRAYIDGFNLYHRALKKTKFKWLNVRTLSEEMLKPEDSVDLIRYFTADVSPRAGDPTAPERQQAYYRALRTVPGIQFHKGRFMPRPKLRPLVGFENCFVEVHDTEEKGSDVNLATFLLRDAFRDEFDVALVVSQDTDLLEPLRIVKHEIKKIVGVVWLEDGSPGKKHRAATSFIRHANPSVLKRCQFPDPVIGKGGLRIPKPDEWY